MPHSVSHKDDERRSFSAFRPLPGKAPSNTSDTVSQAPFPTYDEDHEGSYVRTHSPLSSQNGLAKDTKTEERWMPRKENTVHWGNDNLPGRGSKHGRQTSLTEAFHIIRGRRGSVTANAHELADALKAPVSMRLVIYCVVWYLTSALTNTSSKSIMNAFPRPVTLTLIQFAFVSSFCVLLSFLSRIYPSLAQTVPALRHGIQSPSRDVIRATLPLAFFQVGGHLLSSTATSRIDVSLVHTIKGLSPLFTVFAYRFFFRIHHALATYLSLIPLTLGVTLACSAELSGNLFGILCAFGAAIIFVSQNIFAKKLFNEAARAEADGLQQTGRKLDKLNMLCYCSGLAFVLTAPLWLWSEGFMLVGDFFHDGALDLSEKKGALGPGGLALEFLFNGTFHFGQNIMAFVLLSMISPVTYSVASLIKRIFVITVAIVWFGKRTSLIQGVGIALTFIGLYLYDRTSDTAKAERRAKLLQIKTPTLLPLSEPPSRPNESHHPESTLSATSGQLYGRANGLVHGLNGSIVEEKVMSSAGTGRPRGSSSAKGWPSSNTTREEDSWRPPGVAVPSHTVPIS